MANQVRLYRKIDRSILRPAEITAGGRVKGTLYFPVIGEKAPRIRLSIDGTTGASRDRMPLRLICNVPRIAGEGAMPEPVPVIRTVSPGAKITAGPVQITVSVIEFWTDATVVELAMTNTADVEADIFAGLADATLTDQAGKTLAVRQVRSEFPERIPAKGTVTAKLAFEGLPSGQSRELTLRIPRIQVAAQSFESRIQLRVQF